uniref:hypothetical protein n=1 Tax=Nonomuraea sp. CA-252377 TaxID=3240003 RepID=UPI003F4987D3
MPAAAPAGLRQGKRLPDLRQFTTDATFLPELELQQQRTGQLIDERRQAFKARTGQEMSRDNVWLAGRLQEHDALGRVILKIE